MILLYVLDEAGEPLAMPDTLAWAAWFETHERTIAIDFATPDSFDVYVSTVFLGIDHAFGGGPPVLWETMIFGGPRDQDSWRYTSRAAALIGHAEALAWARVPTR